MVRALPAVRVTPYGVVAAVALALMVPVCLELPWRGDIGHHAATVDRLRVDLLHPTNPLVDTPGGSPYYSPYALGAALVARATGLTGLQVLSLCAAVNVALLVTGLRAFVRVLTPRRWAPALAVPAFSLLWGYQVFIWGGFFSLVSLCLSVSYPSLFALGLTLHLWALAGRAVGRGPRGRVRPGLPWHTGLGLVGAAVMVSHPITGAAAALGGAALAAGRLRSGLREGPRRWGAWLLACAVAVAGVLFWPYYNVLTLAGSHDLDSFHIRMYDHMPARYGLALVGVPALLARWRRDRLDPLVLLFAGGLAAVGYGWWSGHYTWGRLLSVVLLSAQCALAIALAAPRPWSWPRRVTGVAAAVAACVGLWTQSGALLYMVPGRVLPDAVASRVEGYPSWPRYDWLAPHVRYGDVVLAGSYLATHMLPAYGLYTVAPAYPTPPVTQGEVWHRWLDTRAFLDPASSGRTRAVILRRYHVSWLLVSAWEQVPPPDRYTRYEEVAANRRGERLFRVTPGPDRLRSQRQAPEDRAGQVAQP